jgi:hypothetical protein
MDPLQSVDWLEREMIPVFPLGEVKTLAEGAPSGTICHAAQEAAK